MQGLKECLPRCRQDSCIELIAFNYSTVLKVVRHDGRICPTLVLSESQRTFEPTLDDHLLLDDPRTKSWNHRAQQQGFPA